MVFVLSSSPNQTPIKHRGSDNTPHHTIVLLMWKENYMWGNRCCGHANFLVKMEKMWTKHLGVDPHKYYNDGLIS